MRLTLNDFRKGIWAVSGKETTLKGYVRRARGMHAIRTPSLRSRLGSTQLFNLANVNALYRFDNIQYQATTAGVLYRNGVSILTGLNGSRLTFVRMPPQGGIFDYLFLAGGGLAQKVNTGGSPTNWGITAPNSDLTLADGGAGAMGAGTYQYYMTFKCLATGSRSNPNPLAQSITIAASHQVSLSNIPTSTDPQVNAREIYRTNAGGQRFFRIATLANNTATTYTDNAADGASSIESFEIQFDNNPPSATYQDAWGPYNGQMWWTRDTASSATKGYVYYSPPGRPESVRGFISVTNPDDNLQKGVVWNGSNWVFSQGHLYQILGDSEPFLSREVQGVPGTDAPFTVKATPYGIVYKSYDGLRLFDGTRSQLIGFDALGPLFRGENLENLTSFQAVIAEYARDEYFVSDLSQGLAISLADGSWRDLGVALQALFQEPNTRHLQASFSSKVHSFEDWTTATDSGAPITLEWELGGALTDLAHHGTIQRIFIDINTNNQTITPSLIADGTTIILNTITTASRQLIELPVGRDARVFSVRLTGTLTASVELFAIGMDVQLEGANPEVGIG